MPSPRDKRKHKKSVERKKKQKKSGSHAGSVETRIRQWAATVGAWPLRTCVVSPWLEERKQGVIIVAHSAPDGSVAGALFLFDLGCLGLRAAVPFGPEADEDFEKRMAEMALSAAHHEISRPHARAILRVAIDGAAELGWTPRPDHAALLSILGSTAPVEPFKLPSFGWGGKPLYVEWEDDDAARTLDSLEARFGAHGFHHVDSENSVRVALEAKAVSEADLATRLARCAELESAIELLARYGAFDEQRVEYSRLASEFDGEELPEFELNGFELQLFIRGELEDGLSLLELFSEHEQLTDWDRDTIADWADMRFGMFRMVSRSDEHVVLESVVAGVRYVVHALSAKTDWPGENETFPAQLVPFEDRWLAVQIAPPVDDSLSEELAAGLASLHPRLLFDSPELLEAGWKRQREMCEDFEAFFGSRVVSVSGRELPQKIDEWVRYHQERVAARFDGTDHPDAMPAQRALDVDDDVDDEDQAFLLCGERWGIHVAFFFDELEALYRDPGLMQDRKRAAVLDDYVEMSSITPLPFEILAQRYPEGASAVFAVYRTQPDFDWGRDGENLLREIKAEHYEPLPTTCPMPKKFLEALNRAEYLGEGSESSSIPT